MVSEYCRDDMDDQDLDIKVNGKARDDTESLAFRDIPRTYDTETVFETVSTPSNSIQVDFGAYVDVTVFQIFSETGEVLPENLTILLTGLDENGEMRKLLLNLTNGEFVVDEEFPPVNKVNLTFVASDQESFEIRPEFLGCLKPGMSMFTLASLMII